MTLEDYKKNKNGHTGLKFLKKLFTRVFICGILVLTVLIICNLSDTTKALIKKELFQTDFNFSKITKLYNNLFNKKDDSEKVSLNNGITYEGYEDYLDGVSLNTTEGDSISLLESGIVVYIGQKDGYGNTIIVQQSNGVDVWYGNVDNVSINLYDYVNKGTAVATSKDNLYLLFQKDGEYLDYKEFIK